MMKKIIYILLLLLPFATAEGQKKPRTKLKNVKSSLYTESYYVLASDTSIKHGKYKLTYKGKTIEEGEYKKGERIGDWAFYNLQNKVEFYYDYNTRLPFRIAQKEGTAYSARNFPALYLGSPMVPYHFIAMNSYYPMSERDNKEDCTVVLALKISAQGRMTGYYIKQESKQEFNDIVLKAAAKIPMSWRFVPARENGRNVASDYLITVVFEAVD